MAEIIIYSDGIKLRDGRLRNTETIRPVMDPHLSFYVVRYFDHLMSKPEQFAYRHLLGTMKVTKGRSDSAAQQHALRTKPHLRDLFSSDPEVLELTRDGIQTFMERTATRMLAEHADEIFLNHCPKCGALAKTPKARQCRFCFHDWHKTAHV